MDLPGYHFWLQKSSDERIAILTKWISGFDTMHKAIELILQLIRDSAVPRWELAENGFFQRNLDPANPCQILRISLPAEQDCYPEISGGKHRFTVRFLRQESDESRPKQINQDIEFEMSCCMI
jgi:cell division protein ZapD